jgi:hypothetical protein
MGKALVTTLMHTVIEGVPARPFKEITTELCGREFSRQTVSNLIEKLGSRFNYGPNVLLRGSARLLFHSL